MTQVVDIWGTSDNMYYVNFMLNMLVSLHIHANLRQCETRETVPQDRGP